MASASSITTVQKSYIAYYGRPADPIGLDYWATALDTANGNMSALINAFGTSAEATALYAGQSTAQMVNSLYLMLFDREAEVGGLTYYVNRINTGASTLATVALDILYGATTGADAASVANKLAAANAFTAAIDTTPEMLAYSGNTAATTARTWLADVDATTTTTPDPTSVLNGLVTANQTFALTADATSADEGSSATFTLATTNVSNGGSIAYTLSGVSAADVTGGSLTGTATVTDNKATITVGLVSDLTTEGAETLKVSLDNGKASATTTVNDTSLTPTYTLTGSSTVAEGASATYTLTSSSATQSGTIDYTIAGTGITAADVTGGLTGTATMTNGVATITVAAAGDATTEGTETMTVTAKGQTVSTTITDASITPVLVADSVAGTIVNGQGTAIMTAANVQAFNDNDTTAANVASTGTVTVDMASAVGGQLISLQNGNLMFVADAGVRQGSFSYSDSDIAGKTGTVNVTLNSAPVITSAATLAATEDTAATGTVVATDADSDTLTYTFANGSKGTVTAGTAGAFTYTPTANANGTDTFKVTVSDGYTTSTQDIAVTIAAVDDAPALVSPAPATKAVTAGQDLVTIDLATYATDVDTAAGSLVYTLGAGTTAKGGAVTVSGSTATIVYPEGGGSAALGADTFSFTVSDGVNPAVAATVNLNITNTAPVGTDFALSAKTGVTQTVDLTGKATDADGNTLTPAVTLGSLSNGGSAEVLNGKIVYTSTVGYVGTETLKYTVTDGFGGTSAEKTITFTVASNTGGTSGDDLLYGSTAAEAIDGLAGNDTINGGGGLDTITGGDGNDRITFSDGAVQILGAAGNDTLVVNSDAVAAAFDLSLGTNQMIDGNSKNSLNNAVVVRTFENIDATKSSGDFVLNSKATLGAYNAALGGDAVLTTSIITGSGNDGVSFSRATGTVTVQTNDGNDTIFVNNDGVDDTASGKFSIEGGAGNDTINVSSTTAAHTILGGAGNDVITDGTGTTSVDGGDGNDGITGGSGQETLLGGAGDDTISSGGGNDSIDGGAGNDSLTAGAGADSLYGGLGNDELIGAAGVADYLDAGDGDDTFTMAGNLTTADSLYGGAGNDTVAATGVASITLSSYTKATSIEKWDLTDAGGGIAVTASSATGLTDVIIREGATGAQTVGVSGLAAGVGVTLQSVVDNQTIGTTTLALADATGTTDSINVTLKGAAASTTAGNVVATLVTTGFESVNILSSKVSGTAALTTTLGNQNIISTLTDANLTTLTLTGSDALTISALGASTAPTTVNASAMTGAFAVTMSNASSVALTGGSANDTFTFGTTLSNGDTVVGGGGTGDALTATVTSLTATTGVLRISEVESINLTEAGTTTIDVTNITGASAVNFAGGSTALTITNLPASGLAVGLGFTGGATNHSSGTVTASLASSSGTADSLTFNLQSTAGNTATLVTSGIENLTLAVNSETNGANALTLTNMTASKLTITGSTNGNNDQVQLGTLNAATTTVDASGFTGITTATASASATAFLVAGGVVDTIDGGAGNDTFTVTSVGTTALDLDGAAGTDTLTLSAVTGALDFTNVANFESISFKINAGVTATPSNYSGFNDSDVKTITVTGGGLSSGVDSALVFVGTSLNTALTTFDASGYASAVTLSYTTELLDSTVTVKGGSGSSDSIFAGYDTPATVAPVISGFETVKLQADTGNTGSETYTFNLASVTGASTVAFGTGNGAATTVNVTNYDGSGTLALGHAAAGTEEFLGAGSTFNVTLASATGSSDALNLKLVDTNDAAATIAVTGTGIEAININAGASTSTEDHKIDLSGVATTSSAAQTITITGGMSDASNGTYLTITNVNASATTINASAFIGSLALSDRPSTAMTITGGTGADNIRMENAADVLTAGTQATGQGGDTLTVAMTGVGGALIVDLSSATDQVTLYNGLANSAAQTGFENVDATAYNNSAGLDFTAIAGGSAVAGTNQTDVITLGAGTDTVQFYNAFGSVTGSDTINTFTAGTDILKFDISQLGLAGGTEYVGAIGALAVDSSEEIAVLTGLGYATDAAAVAAVAARVTTDGLDMVVVYFNTTDNTAHIIHDSDAGAGTGTTTLLASIASITLVGTMASITVGTLDSIA